MKKYFLIGEKLGHSYSAELHGFNGINYGLKEIPRDKLPAFFRERNFDGRRGRNGKGARKKFGRGERYRRFEKGRSGLFNL